MQNIGFYFYSRLLFLNHISFDGKYGMPFFRLKVGNTASEDRIEKKVFQSCKFAAAALNTSLFFFRKDDVPLLHVTYCTNLNRNFARNPVSPNSFMCSTSPDCPTHPMALEICLATETAYSTSREPQPEDSLRGEERERGGGRKAGHFFLSSIGQFWQKNHRIFGCPRI